MANRSVKLLTSHGMKLIPEKLAGARIAKRWTQKGLADFADLSLSTIESFESGRRQPYLETLEHLATVLEVSVEDLTERTE